MHGHLLASKSRCGPHFLQATNKLLAWQIDTKADTVCVSGWIITHLVRQGLRHPYILLPSHLKFAAESYLDSRFQMNTNFGSMNKDGMG